MESLVFGTKKDKTQLNDAPTKTTYTYYEGKEVVYTEEYLVNGKRDRSIGPAHIVYYPNGVVRAQTYYKEGEVHRDNGPAYIEYDRFGRVILCHYYRNNVLRVRYGYHTITTIWTDFIPDVVYAKAYRSEEMVIYRNTNGAIIGEKAYEWGKLHKDKGPADCTYYPNGSIKSQKYYKDGVLTRKRKAAVIEYDSQMKIKVTKHYTNGKLDRKDGPAIQYYTDGVVTSCEYYEDGEKKSTLISSS